MEVSSVALREGPVKSALRSLFIELVGPAASTSSSAATRTVNPSELLGAVVAKAPRFRGAGQHDAQEMLRFLLDRVQEEELVRSRRQARAAAAAAGEDGETAVASMSAVLTAAGGDAVTRIFGGRLLSLVRCSACSSLSCVTEPFLDVSLPLPGSPLDDDAAEFGIRYGGQRRSKHASAMQRPAWQGTGKMEKRSAVASQPASAPAPVQAPAAAQSRSSAGSRAARREAEDKAELARLSRSLGISPDAFLPSPPDVAAAAARSLDDAWLDSKDTPKVALVEWLQRHAPARLLVQLSIKRGLPPAKHNHAIRGAMVGAMKDLRRAAISAAERAAADKKPAAQAQAPAALSPAKESPPMAEVNSALNAPAAAAASLSVLPAVVPAMIPDAELVAACNAAPSVAPEVPPETVSDEATAVGSQPDATACDLMEISKTAPSVADPVTQSSTDLILPPAGPFAKILQLSTVSLPPEAEVAATDSDKETQSVQAPAKANGRAATASTAVNDNDDDEDAESATGGELSLTIGGATSRVSLPKSTAASAAAGSEGSLAACLELFAAPEPLLAHAGNGYACETCRVRKHGAAPAAPPALAGSSGSTAPAPAPADERPRVLVNAVKRLLLLGPTPPVLVVHLKRFCGAARTQKVGGHVAFPEVLDLAPYTAAAAAAAPAPSGAAASSALFRLAAVVVHSGTMSGGHYIAFVRHGAAAPFRHGALGCELLPPCGSLWAMASDRNVAPATLAEVLASEAYLIFYERVTRGP